MNTMILLSDTAEGHNQHCRCQPGTVETTSPGSQFQVGCACLKGLKNLPNPFLQQYQHCEHTYQRWPESYFRLWIQIRVQSWVSLFFFCIKFKDKTKICNPMFQNFLVLVYLITFLFQI